MAYFCFAVKIRRRIGTATAAGTASASGTCYDAGGFFSIDGL
jgi:hypothetical protein